MRDVFASAGRWAGFDGWEETARPASPVGPEQVDRTVTAPWPPTTYNRPRALRTYYIFQRGMCKPWQGMSRRCWPGRTDKSSAMSSMSPTHGTRPRSSPVAVSRTSTHGVAVGLRNPMYSALRSCVRTLRSPSAHTHSHTRERSVKHMATVWGVYDAHHRHDSSCADIWRTWSKTIGKLEPSPAGSGQLASSRRDSKSSTFTHFSSATFTKIRRRPPLSEPSEPSEPAGNTVDQHVSSTAVLAENAPALASSIWNPSGCPPQSQSSSAAVSPPGALGVPVARSHDAPPGVVSRGVPGAVAWLAWAVAGGLQDRPIRRGV